MQTPRKTLDEQLRALCEEHDLASISVTMMRGHGRVWPQVQVQWYDDSKSHGRGIASSDHDIPVGEGVKQAIKRMNAERGKPAVVSELEAVSLMPDAEVNGWHCTCCRSVFTASADASFASEHHDPSPNCPGCKAGNQYTYPYRLHQGDPCEVCGIPHDDVAPGPCSGVAEAA